MTADERKEIRAKLDKMRRDLRDQIHEIKKDLRSSGENGRSFAGKETGDGIFECEDIDTRAQLMERARIQLLSIETALQRMEDGTYGICSFPLCGQEISMARLRSIPTATRCIKCQVRVEGFIKDRPAPAKIRIPANQLEDDD